MTTAAVLDSPGAVDEVYAEWDRLAVAAKRPFCAPAWMLAWWEHMRPDGAELCIVAVESDDDLVGVLPLYSVGGSLALLGEGICPVEPVAAPGQEERVAAAAVEALADAEPGVEKIKLWTQDDSPEWPQLLGQGWPGGGDSWEHVVAEAQMPKVTFDQDGFDGWMRSRDGRFRGEVRRLFRRLEDGGASFRFANADTLDSDVSELLRLHRSRLEPRGGTTLQEDGVEGMLRDAGDRLVDNERFRLLCLDMDDKTIASQLHLVAGDRASGWVSGFDDDYKRYSPAVQCMVYSVKDSAESGQRTMSLGPGRQRYKYRLATGDGSFTSAVLVPPGKGHLRTRGREYLRSAMGSLRLSVHERRERIGRKLGRRG